MCIKINGAVRWVNGIYGGKNKKEKIGCVSKSENGDLTSIP